MKKIASTLIALLLLCSSAAAQLGPATGPSGPGSGSSVPAGSITVGTTAVSGGTTTRVLFDNAGVLGEYVISGSGNVAMTTSPVFTTPTLGAATATTINSLTISTSTGTLTITNGKTVSHSSTTTFAGVDGKTLTVNNSLTLAGTDASTLNIGAGGTLGGYAFISSGQLTNSIAGNVALNNTGTFFIGPTVSQGSTGTWCASGTVTLFDSVIANFAVRLWDGTTVISSANASNYVANKDVAVTLSGCIVSPAGNIRIEAKDVTATTGGIQANDSGQAKDSTITVWRVN